MISFKKFRDTAEFLILNRGKIPPLPVEEISDSFTKLNLVLQVISPFHSQLEPLL